MWIAWIATSCYNNELSSKNIVLCTVYSVCQRSNQTSFFVFNNACPSLTFPFQSPIEVYSFTRSVSLTSTKNNDSGPHTFLRGGFRTNSPRRQNCASLLSANQVIRALPPNKVPLKDVYPRGQSLTLKSWEHIFIVLIGCLVGPPDVTPPMTAGYLEVVDLNFKKVKYVPIPRWTGNSFS